MDDIDLLKRVLGTEFDEYTKWEKSVYTSEVGLVCFDKIGKFPVYVGIWKESVAVCNEYGMSISDAVYINLGDPECSEKSRSLLREELGIFCDD